MAKCPLGTIEYILKEGDTVYNLAKTYRTSVYDILSANPGIHPSQLRTGQILCIPQSSQMPEIPKCKGISNKELDLRNTMRALWEQHVAWTRMTILAIAASAPYLSVVTARLLRNASDMAMALKPFYGEKTANKFGDLIKSHLLIAYQLVTASKAGDKDAATKADKAWYENAADIAETLASINPYWPKKDLLAMLNRHLDLTKSEAVAILQNDMAKSIDLYDTIETQALSMADALSQGIVSQFPDAFSF